MNLEDQVVSLCLAKKLNELGVKRESLFYWHDKNGNESSYCIIYTKGVGLKDGYADYSAFTIAELGEMLPKELPDKETLKITKYYNIWCVNYCLVDCHFEDRNEANARAKMLIHLLENKLMEIPK